MRTTMRRSISLVTVLAVVLASFLTPFLAGASTAYAQAASAPAGGGDPCDPCADLRKQLADAEAELAANLARQEELGHQLAAMRAELEHRRAHVLTGYRNRSDPDHGLLTDNPGGVDAGEWEQIWQSESDLAAIAALEAAIAAAEAELAALRARAEALRSIIDDLRRQLEDCERRARDEAENRCPGPDAGDSGAGDPGAGDPGGCHGSGHGACPGGDEGGDAGGDEGSDPSGGCGDSGGGACPGGDPTPPVPGSGVTDGGGGGSDDSEDPCDPCADLRKQLADAEAELAANLAAQDQLRGVLEAMRARLAEMRAHVLHGYRSTTNPSHGLLTDRPEGVDPSQWEEIWQQQADPQGIAQLEGDIAEAEEELAGLELEEGDIRRRIDDLRRRLKECEEEAAKKKKEECDPKGGLFDWLIDLVNWFLGLFGGDGVDGSQPPEVTDFGNEGWVEVDPLPTELVQLDLVSALPPVEMRGEPASDARDPVVPESRDRGEPVIRSTEDPDRAVEQPVVTTTTTQPKVDTTTTTQPQHTPESPVWKAPDQDQPAGSQPTRPQSGERPVGEKIDSGAALS